jgi:conjugative transfer region protein TrbK
MSRSLLGKALMLLGAAMILTMIVIGTIGQVSPDGQRLAIPPPPANSQPNPQQSEVLRCQSLGEAAAKDAACLDLWADTRRRFLAPVLPPGEGG